MDIKRRDCESHNIKGDEVKKKIAISLLILVVVTVSLFAAEPRKGVGLGLTTGIPFHILTFPVDVLKNDI